MKAQHLAWIRTKNPGGSGSGYLIGPQLVLTALHVVLPDGGWAKQVEVRVGHPRFGDLAERRAQVCWPDTRQGVPPEDALDVALLWLETPVTGTDGPVRWGQPGGVVPLPFNGAGLPAFADEALRGDFEDLRGKLPVISTASSSWVLNCDVWPDLGRDGQRPWAGASGAAIFCHDRLVGVAVEDNRTMGWRRLQAVPIHEALSLPGFAKLITRHGHPGTTTTLDDVTAKNTDVEKDTAAWQIEVGPIPARATAFQPRTDLRAQIDAAWADNGSVVLIQEATRVLSGGGGVGKTQMAAAYATDALRNDADLVVWAPAADLQQMIARYAEAAALLQLPGASGQDLEADAQLLVRWLRTTPRRWLIVLDDISDPDAVDPWWPVSLTGTGRVLATTRRRDARLTGNGRIRVDIDVYTPTESSAYLHQRLAAENMSHLLDDHTTALTESLGHLPLGLGMAAAHMINEELTAGAYLHLFNDRRARLEKLMPATADTDRYHKPTQPTQITTALLLSLDAAQTADTTGLATTLLHLTAHLDPAGHPHALWNAPALLNYLTHHHTPPPPSQDDTTTHPAPVTAEQTHSTLRLLHRYALLICDTRAEPRAVSIHALTARATRETTSATDIPALTNAAADALLQIWPDLDQHHVDQTAALRANTSALAHHTGDHLWQPEGHPVLYRAGNSLLNTGLAASSTTYWRAMVADAERLLGGKHSDTLAARANLASSYWQAGRTGEAIVLLEQVVADTERLLGGEHPDTLTARGNLATSYWQAGRTEEAIVLLEQVVVDRERLLGGEHPHTLTARANLAASYQQAGRTEEAINLLEQVVVDRERLLGGEHPDTLAARANLASSYGQAGRTEEAIVLLEQVVVDRERLLGGEHPDTLTARGNLATSYRQAGRTGEAIVLLEQVVADTERLLGGEHPDTLTARANLATSYWQAGRTGEAIVLLEQVVADTERLLGGEHPSTLTARGNLAASYQQAGRTEEAINLLEQVVVDRERLLGGEHPHTLTARGNLAASYRQAGRTEEAINLLEQVVADTERLLGGEHPDTLTAHANLAGSYRQAGRTEEAINLLERVAADAERLLGGEHPHTLAIREMLSHWRST